MRNNNAPENFNKVHKVEHKPLNTFPYNGIINISRSLNTLDIVTKITMPTSVPALYIRFYLLNLFKVR